MADMHDLKVGDRIKDNDPRTGYPDDRVLQITALLPNGVQALTPLGQTVEILRRRIYTDGKPRRTGFSLVRE